MKKLIKLSAFVCVFMLWPMLSIAQDIADKQGLLIAKMIFTSVLDGYNEKYITDNLTIYGLNFRVRLVKNRSNKTIATKVSANDSLAYTIFPNYKKLYTFNYNGLIGQKRETTLIIPILIVNSDHEKVKNRNSLIDIRAAKAAAFALYSSGNYNEDPKSPQYKLYEDVTLMSQFLVEIFNQPKQGK